MKRIAFDIDGCLADLISPMLQILEIEHKKIVKYEDITDFNLEKSFQLDSKQIHQIIDEAIQNYENLFPYPGVVEFLVEYQKEHKNILIITQRKIENDYFTRRWFEKFFPLIDMERIQIAYSYNKMIPLKFYRIDQMVEDRAEVAISLANQGIKVFLMDRPWNQFDDSNENITRVKNWEDIKNYGKE